MAANSWWERINETNRTAASQPKGMYDFSKPSYTPALTAPADWEAFRQNFGGGYAKMSDYENWRLGQQRERSLADFVDRMSAGDTGVNNYVSQMGGDYTKYQGVLDDWINGARPTASTTNRFEAGLSANEARLNALLDDPETVRQTAAYKFRLKQGEEALQRNLGAKGMLRSGNRLQALTQYGQDMGSQEYDAQAKRLSDLVGMYSGNWINDKNANTQRYAAESQAWNQRGSTLADIFAKAGQNYNSAQNTKADSRLGWGNVWANQAPKAQQWSITNG